jgi:hypothetical protein
VRRGLICRGKTLSLLQGLTTTTWPRRVRTREVRAWPQEVLKLYQLVCILMLLHLPVALFKQSFRLAGQPLS